MYTQFKISTDIYRWDQKYKNSNCCELFMNGIMITIGLSRFLTWKMLIMMYVVLSISLQTFLVQAFKIVVDSWKFSMLLLYIIWDDWPIFMISGLNEQLQQELEYTLLKPDCHSWWISKMQSGREDTLEE